MHWGLHFERYSNVCDIKLDYSFPYILNTHYCAGSTNTSNTNAMATGTA